MNVKKIGRNDPCPCSSGKKYKQCCMQQHEARQTSPHTAAAPNELQAALEHHMAGRLEHAEAIYREILQSDPNHADALHYSGLISQQKGESQAATDLIGKAIAANPNDAFAHCNMGNALLSLTRLEDALASYDRALQLKPDFVEALYNRGSALLDLRRYAEALDCFDRALDLKPDFSQALCNRGNALLELKRHEEALDGYRRALRFQPDDPIVHNSLGVIFLALGRFDEAAASCRQALLIRPEYAVAHNTLGSVLQAQKQLDDAVACYAKAAQLTPEDADAHYNLGSVLNNLGSALIELHRNDEAIASIARALEIRPDFVKAHYNLGTALQNLQRFEEAANCYRTVLTLDPNYPHAFGMLANCALHTCDWSATARHAAELFARITSGRDVVMPFHLFGFPSSPAEQLACAKRYLRDVILKSPPPLWNGEIHAHDKIRVAYLSADFHQHATACLMAELFELHDRSRFEIIGISFGPDDQSPIRARLVTAFDRFFDIRSMSDADAACLLRRLETDIAVDLKGYTQGARAGILAHRPAPIQVNYLGYPGTMGADFIDYVIADKTILPLDQQAHYTECIVHLPDCYQVNDSKRAIAQSTPTRAECGLPDDGFVFCCFNSNYKITQEIFDVWMRLLKSVDSSVLWLLQDNDIVQRNLRAEAATRGVDPARLVFAPRTRLDLHLARHRLADLFVDTLPINAHTTASDALWAGLPVVTCLGSTFAGRVAGSLLRAIGLPELVTENLRDYETLALTLATDPSTLQALRTRLERNRLTSSLFDTDKFRQNLEAAYDRMHAILQRGEKPIGFVVE